MSVAKEEYPYVQFSAEPHTHEFPGTVTCPGGWKENHAHRTYTQFHGHQSLPLDRSIMVRVIVPGEPEPREPRRMGDILDTLEQQSWKHLLHPQTP